MEKICRVLVEHKFTINCMLNFIINSLYMQGMKFLIPILLVFKLPEFVQDSGRFGCLRILMVSEIIRMAKKTELIGI